MIDPTVLPTAAASAAAATLEAAQRFLGLLRPKHAYLHPPRSGPFSEGTSHALLAEQGAAAAQRIAHLLSQREEVQSGTAAPEVGVPPVRSF